MAAHDDTNGKHRWSGWPGAMCLRCFIEDPIERCVATDPDCHCLDGMGDTGHIQTRPCKVTVPDCTGAPTP